MSRVEVSSVAVVEMDIAVLQGVICEERRETTISTGFEGCDPKSDRDVAERSGIFGNYREPFSALRSFSKKALASLNVFSSSVFRPGRSAKIILISCLTVPKSP
jgi:hypothetical protein